MTLVLTRTTTTNNNSICYFLTYLKQGISCTNDQIFLPSKPCIFSLNVQVYIRAFKKVGFQLPKNKGEITTLCKTLTVK